MITLKGLEGHVTVVLTQELRELALARLHAADYGDDSEALVEWFSPAETPDNHVLDAAYWETESLMVSVIVDAINDLHRGVAHEVHTSDPDEFVRIITRH